MSHYFILKWRGGAQIDGSHRVTRIWLVGPFAIEAEAVEWARKDQDDTGNDPRWQLVTPHVESGSASLELPIRSPADREA